MNIQYSLSKVALPVLLGCTLAPAAAQTPAGGGADTSAGQRIATTGDPTKGVIACVTCHGAQGEGNASSGFPRLAGQSAAYLREQLDSYADGRRQNPIMAPIAKGMGADDRAAVAAYYAGLKPPPAPGAAAAPAQQPEARKRAETLYTSGDESLRIQGCANCHGPGGVGQPPTYPYLAGQHASYLGAALREFKAGTRTNDPTGQMAAIARQLSDADMDALSAYLSQLPAPTRDDAQAAAIREQAAKGASVPSPRQSGPSAPSGTGAEQGAPFTGGGQGPGGGGGGSGTGSSGSGSGH